MDEEQGRDGEIHVQLLRLGKALEGLRATVGDMDERLGSVLRPVTGKPDKGTEAKEKCIVPLAEIIRTHRRGVEAQTARLRRIITRIEL